MKRHRNEVDRVAFRCVRVTQPHHLPFQTNFKTITESVTPENLEIVHRKWGHMHMQLLGGDVESAGGFRRAVAVPEND